MSRTQTREQDVSPLPHVPPSPSPIVDVGANLGHRSFQGDLDETLARAAAAGVSAVIVTGTSAKASRRALELLRDRPGAPLYSTAGIHPHEARTWCRDVMDELLELHDDARVVAVGECGLDYDRDFSPRDVQRRCFVAQLELAARVGKPVFLHEREAHDDFFSIAREHRASLSRGGVVHCFTGTRAMAERYVGLDLYVGVTGWICDDRRGGALREAVSVVPRDRLLIETDAPFLTPRDLPRAPRRNEPALLAHVLRAVAKARGESVEDVARATTDNARRLFGLGLA